ncbi:MAG TPA: protein kinase [Ktedonobacteraceae bacterium]|nr:protein kinase [Ktedonobacteraceae bacterium]
MALEGMQLGRYRILSLIGSGNMGEVYLAEDTLLNRQVAIKLIRTEGSSYPNPEAVKESERLFQREAKAIAALDHPNILPLYDYGEQIVNGAPTTYMVMPLRKDGSFATWLQQRGTSNLLSFEEVGYFVRHAADALQHAHNHQVTHQDVKPSNFLIQRNEQANSLPNLQLGDFGIAKFTTGTAGASRTIRGTPAYMAPEQWMGNPAQASDQYALAIMAYDLLTGRLPFQGTLANLMYQHFQEQPRPPSQLNPKLPPEVDAVFNVALAKQPEARFKSVSAFAEALRQALHLQSTGAIATSITNNDDSTVVRTPPPLTGNDIHTSIAISAAEAQTGTQRVLNFADGRQANVVIPPGAYHGQILRLEGQGRPSPYGGPAGALLISIIIAGAQTIPTIPGQDDLAPTVAAAPLTPPPPPPISPVEASYTSQQRQGVPMSIIILLVVFALLAGLGGGGFLYFSRANLSNTNQINTGSTNPETTPSHPQNTVTTGTTPQGQPDATATTPTNSGPANPYTQGGTLVLNDPLTRNNYGWDTGTNSNNAVCQFTSQGLEVIQPKQGYFHGCIAKSTNFSNFAYEVQVNMISGDYVGIIFCANKAQGNYYFFYIKPNGDYALQIYSGDKAQRTITSGTSSAITTGLPATNVLAVVVQNGSIRLYVNQTDIANISNTLYPSGQIGVFSGNDTDIADAVFSNARVWQL